MPLINCKECNTEVSDRAATCVKCGYPLKEESDKEWDDVISSIGLSHFDYFKLCFFKKYATFDGRARRKEYWGFWISAWVICLVSILAAAFISPFMIIPASFFIMAIIIPTLAVCVRRLHDTGRSGTWILVPLVGLLIVAFADSQPGENDYGPNPKGVDILD
ncbi:MAG: DUF805 domain-containing protein [Chitinispirillales bacterium]|jgi:uncharacterized membrane protein YhaH (DUF805 family)|nr:DUF805 domain-containing protein [Chitinispirillales bacterium]